MALTKAARILNDWVFYLFWEIYHPMVGNKMTVAMFARTFGFSSAVSGFSTIQCLPPGLAQDPPWYYKVRLHCPQRAQTHSQARDF